MRYDKCRTWFVFCAAVISLFAAVALLFWFDRSFEDFHRANARVVLELTRRNLQETLFGGMNKAVELAEMMKRAPADPVLFLRYADKILKKETAICAYLVTDDKVVSIWPKGKFTEEIGRQLREYPYAFSLSRLIRGSFVGGPVDIDGKGSCFFFIHSMFEGKRYLGEVIVAAKADYVLKQLNMAYLRQSGYEYELWRVSPQDGNKEVVEASDPHNDLSDAERCTFYMPTEWTLMIRPIGGWISPRGRLLLFGGGAFVIILLSGCIVLFYITLRQRRQISSILSFDHETGFLNRDGFLEELKRLAASRGKNEYTIIYFAMDEYIRLARIMDEKQKNEYMEHTMRCLRDYIYSPHITARMGEAGYAVAIFEKMEMKEAGDIARGISLELLWKTKIRENREYIHADWYFVRCPEEGTDPESLIVSAIKGCEEKRQRKAMNGISMHL
ncbi:hypothetical protein [Cloacibacillus sp.]